MISNQVCEELLSIARRLDRMPLASHRDPHRPHQERSEIVRAIEVLARDVERRFPVRNLEDLIVVREVTGERRLAAVEAAHCIFTRETR